MLSINDILIVLHSKENLKLEIGGHADKGTGDDFVNDNLSFLRAERVYKYLEQNGLNMDNITYKGYGSKQEKYGDERDRRIEFTILPDIVEEIYIVKQGDYLNKIAKEYDVKVKDIRQWNNIYTDHLTIGQKIILYLE